MMETIRVIGMDPVPWGNDTSKPGEKIKEKCRELFRKIRPNKAKTLIDDEAQWRELFCVERGSSKQYSPQFYWRQKIYDACEHLRNTCNPLFHASDRLKIELVFSCKAGNGADLDNLIKPVIDTLCTDKRSRSAFPQGAVFYFDDHNIDQIVATKKQTDNDYGVIITISKI